MNLFSYIKSKVSIIDVVNEYTNLKRAGLYYKAHCPFHHEKTASFTVSPGKEIFYCFGCHINGDVISFIAGMEHCSQLEAAKHLADRYHIEIPTELMVEEAEQEVKKRETHFHVCKAFAHWCHEQLMRQSEVLAYVQSRGINKTSINTFMMGFMPGGIKSIKLLLSAMNEQNIMVADLLEAHILQEGAHAMYSPFEERILFPIKDHLGRFCGFGGRIYTPDDARPKYYNSRESNHFEKGSLLFGLDIAKKSIKESETVFLVEGYTDCIAMVQHGYPQTVATLGTACTLEHLKHLSRYASGVYVLYDGDMAGQQAMLRVAELCWQCSMDIYTIVLPEGQDPASLLGSGNSLAPYVAQAQDIFSYFVANVGQNFADKSLQEKLRISKRIIEILSHVDVPLKQDLLIQKASQILGIPVDSIKREIAQNWRGATRTFKQEKIVAPVSNQGAAHRNYPEPSKLEKRLFFAIMNNIQLVNGEREDYLIRYFSEPLRMLLLKVKQEKEAHVALTFDQFFAMLEPDDQRIVSKIIVESQEQVSHETFECLVQQFQRYHWKKMAHDIAVKLETAKRNQSDDAVQNLLHEFLELKKRVLGKNII